MFERLASKLLSRLLSKYFVSNDSVSNGAPTSASSSSSSSSWSNLGVWSGYVSLESLELRKEVVNSYLKSKGLPFELLQCTLRRVEITVPWAKLGLSDGEDAVVVVVVDGVHALLRTNYEFDDEALREAAIQERRQELQDATLFGRTPDKASYASGLSGFLQKRLAEGILKDVLEKLHIHVRDVHVRLEDVQSDPLNPCAVGVTFESLHVQADENVVETVVSPTKQEVPPPSGVIRKVAQLNHFSIYWNALAYDDGVPVELSVLQDIVDSPAALATALERCIIRRATLLSSPLRDHPVETTPKHSFLLLPLDASWYTKLSTDPRNLEERPALESALHLDDLSIQLRDFQCSQISILAAAVKEHLFSKDYRKYRPSVSAKADPRAWWRYAFRIVKLELRKGNMRWSWSRFAKRYKLRKRYCELYQRERLFQIQRENPRSTTRRSSLTSAIPSTTSLPSQDSVSELSSLLPDESTDSLADTLNGEEARELSPDEMDELTAMEDGTRGDLTVHDIILFRALVNARIASQRNPASHPTKSRLQRLMSSYINDDAESKEEYERLLAYLEQERSPEESLVSPEKASLLAVSIHLSLDRGCICLFSPLRSTEDLHQHKRIQQRFLDLTVMKGHVGYSLYGNYESTQIQASLEDFAGTEIRTNRSLYTVVSRKSSDSGNGSGENGSGPVTPQTSNVHAARQDLVSLEIQVAPLNNPDCDVRVNASIQQLEMNLLPDGEWFHKIGQLLSSRKRASGSLASFWHDIGMAQINALASRRAGLLAKLDTAIFVRKNVDMDILIRCPLLRFSGDKETKLTINLGDARFVTDRLAGVASGKLLVAQMKRPPTFQANGEAGVESGDSSVGGSEGLSAKMTTKMNGSDDGTSNSYRKLGVSSFLDGSAMSMVNGGNRMSTRSFYGNAHLFDDQGSEDFPTRLNHGLQSSFYDEFRLEISNTSLSLTCQKGYKETSLVDRFDVQVLIAKSVIPSDHTLCRLRTQVAIQDITLRLTEASIPYISGLARNWINAMNSEVTDTSYYKPSVSLRDGGIATRLGLHSFTDTEDHSLRDTYSDASSVLDEAEFIDAMEGDDTDDAAGDWFDDNWIADAGSVVDSDIRSISKRKRNRRSMSVSDVSSISEGSLGTRRMQTNNPYLSAENLAMLEELVAEEDDDNSGSDADSFQSALSLGGQAALAAEVEDHIRRAEDEVKELKSKLASEAKCSDGLPFLIPEARRRMQLRKALRVDMDRAKAELRALRATHEELLAQLEGAEALGYDQQLESGGFVTAGGGNELNDASGNEVHARAMALVRARKQRSLSNVDEAFKHQLTSGLNRELVRASVVVAKFTVIVEEVGSASLDNNQEKQTLSSSTFEFATSHCTVGLLLRAKEAKLSASVDGIIASMIDSQNDSGAQKHQHLLLGGSSPLALDASREGHDVPIVAPEERVLIITLDRQEKSASGRPSSHTAKATKIRIHVGEIEVVPREESVLALCSFLQYTKATLGEPSASNATIPSVIQSSSVTDLQKLCYKLNGDHSRDRMSIDNKSKAGKIEYTDISFHLSSLRVTMASGDSTIGSFLLSGACVRFLRGDNGDANENRSQLDVRCNNIQVFDLYHRPSGLELLGCRDPYNPVVQMRIRSQLSPLTHNGGWVVGESTSSCLESLGPDDSAWNVHMGAKLTSLFATLSPEALNRIIHSLKLLKSLVSTDVYDAKVSEPPKMSRELETPKSLRSLTVKDSSPLLSVVTDNHVKIPIRWRADFVAKKVSVLFPSTGDISEIDTSHPHLARSNALLSFSLHALMQAAPRAVESLYIRSILSDVSLIRTSDDWPLLESTSVSSEIVFPQRSMVNESCHLRLTVPETCTFNGNRSSSVGTQSDVFESDATDSLNHSSVVVVSISPLRVNLAPQTASLLVAIVEGIKKLSVKRRTIQAPNKSDDELISSDSSLTKLEEGGKFVKMSIESVEVKLLRESERSTSISFADSTAAFLALTIVGSLSQDGNRDEAIFEMGDLCLYDLSTLPGARVFGRDDDRNESLNNDACTDDNIDADASPQIMKAQFTHLKGDSSSANLDIRLGEMQCLVLPTFFRSILSFKSNMREFAAKEIENHDNRSINFQLEAEKHESVAVPFGVQQFCFSVTTVGFECLLPSRDLFAYIRSRSKEPVNVVAFRWKSVLNGTLSSPFQDSTVDVSMLDSLSLANGQCEEVSCLMTRANFRVEDFQVLRTNVRRRPFPRSAAGGPHVSPCTFVVNPPIAGEQRITNSFWFNASYQFAVVSDYVYEATKTENQNETSSFLGSQNASQALEVEAGFVDVLVYIRQSAGGMNDAIRVTIRPILDMFKRKEESEANVNNKDQTGSGRPKLVDSLREANTVCSLQSEGMRATCVPGGATRLTESPIAKCELSRMKIGLVATALPVDPKVAFGSTSHVSAIERLRQAGLERFGVVEPTISGGPVSHMTVGAWLQTEISASYHNRRLVAWEPFIEPWLLNVRLGIDMVRAFRLPPAPWLNTTQMSSQAEGLVSSFVREGRINEKAGERIRDIGRLLRAPFSPGATAAKPADDLIGTPGQMSSSDLSYVMMKSIAPKVVASALYSTDRVSNAYSPLEVQMRTSSLQCLPATDPEKWLELFGYPSITSRGAKRDRAAIICGISDSRPLNLNLTGALIESVLGFLGGASKESIHPTVPHTIRNLTGLTIRFQECLGTEQASRGELVKKTIVSTGSEIPLSLKRTLSQRCDPHQAYILLELGSFEDTAGRINHQDFEISSRSRSTTFFYKTAVKIAVDTVGVRRYDLCHKYNRRTGNDADKVGESEDLGYIIVRVDLLGSTKVVSIESPFVLKNNTEVDLLCELRNHGGVSLLWRSLIPRSLTPMPSEKLKMVKRRYISLPADLVPTASTTEATLSVRALSPDSTAKHESEIPQEFGDQFVPVELPPPFSDKSVARGMIKVSQTNLISVTGSENIGTPVSFNTCGVRIGSVSFSNVEDSPLESAGIMKQTMVPEQRMLFFRPPIIVRNHLPVTIAVQARVKKTIGVLRRTNSTATSIAERINRGEVGHDAATVHEWHDLGILECGKSLSWTGANANEGVEIRVRLSDKLGEPSRKFPDWSTSSIVPSEAAVERLKRSGVTHTVNMGHMTVVDDANVRLQLSASLEFGSNDPDNNSKPRQDICWFSRTLPAAPRVIGVFVPFWVVDSTGEDLEFSSNAAIAGQSSRYSKDSMAPIPTSNARVQNRQEHLGLAALLDDEKLSLLSAKASFEILMIGEKRSSRLAIRRRMIRVYDDVSGSASRWCEPIALKVRDNTFDEVYVPAPVVRSYTRKQSVIEDLEPLALGARVLCAPEEFGGLHGTRLVHVSCRYRIVNEMGRDIEVLSDYGSGHPSTIRADGRPVPLHFDGTSPIRFRPKEFGWSWSGRFSIRKKRKEVTLRLVHALKGVVIIAEVEFVEAGMSGGNVLIFREASHPPFRLENQTMHAIHFCQSSVLFGAERGQMPVALDSTILPYHSADFAWDAPDERRRYLAIEVADLGKSVHRYLIGRFKLDRVVPGNQIRLSDSSYFGQVVADGPTRVVRITDSSLPPLPCNETTGGVSRDIFKKPESFSGPPSLIALKLTHGIGISVIDWVPQELLYIQLDDINAERRVDGEEESLAFSISCVSVDNQMWVTPFPVLMRMGRRSRTEKVLRRRRNAVSVSCRRSLNTQGGLIMLDNFELSTEPVILNVDGYLSERIWDMIRQAVGMRDLIGGVSSNTRSRDGKLQKVLNITEDRHAYASSSTNQADSGGYGNDYDDETFLATSVMVAKLRMRPRSESISVNRPSRQTASTRRNEGQSLLPKQRNKYYIGKCKISTVQTEISWTGPLPTALIKFPDIIRPALTFEALPVMMRPFSMSHAYGTTDDIAHDLKSHYLSIWRVFDFLVGLTFRPTFMIRACIYTWRESCASAFDSISNSLATIEKGLIRQSEPHPASSSVDGQLAIAVYASHAYQRVVGGSCLATASLFHSSSRLTSLISNALRYGGSSRNPASRSVRARNPRLFARVDGNELLVEYVEGENAGKAILSRVRMGRHLGEGHVFHCEGVHLQPTTDTETQVSDLETTALICMVTSERVMLLNGHRHANFCSVVWETTFLNLVEVEFDEFYDSPFDLVKLWYLVDTVHAKGNTDDKLTRYAKTVVDDADFGLDILLCKSIFVPKESGSTLRSKIAAVHRRLDESSSESQRI